MAASRRRNISTPALSRRFNAGVLRGGMRDALVAVDAGRFLRQHGLVHGLHEVLLLGDGLRREYMAMLAPGGVVRFVFVPDQLRHVRALLLELLLGVDHAAHFADRVL